MGREIKFRSWLGKMMWEHGSFDLEIAIKDGGCELMQYTGLKDKNGKEIWEGDILGLIEPEVEGGQSSFGQVQVLFGEYDDSEIEYGSEGIGWYVEGYHGYKRRSGKRDKYSIGGHESQWSLLRCVGNESYDDKWEVIGNIYENGELLNG